MSGVFGRLAGRVRGVRVLRAWGVARTRNRLWLGRWRLAVSLGIALLPLAVACGDDDRPTVRVLAASSLTEVLPELVARWQEAVPEVDVQVRFGGSQALAVQIEEGAPVDLFLSARPDPAARLTGSGLIGEPRPFATNRLALLVPADAPWPTLTALAEAPGLRIAIAAPDVPAGALTEALLDALPVAVAESLREAIVTRDPNVRVVLSRLELGEVDAVFVYETDQRAIEGARALPLPTSVPGNAAQNRYVAALGTGASAAAESAADLLTFIVGDVGQGILAEYGFGTAPAIGAR